MSQLPLLAPGSLMNSHKCPAPGCTSVVQHYMLACRKHWFSLPRPLRDDVWRAYNNGAGMGSPEHNEAVRAAVEWFKGEAA